MLVKAWCSSAEVRAGVTDCISHQQMSVVAKKPRLERPLALGFDAGSTNAGFSWIHVHTGKVTMNKLNLKLKNTPKGWKVESSTETNMERWIDDMIKAYSDVFEQAFALGIECPQKRPIFSAMTWVLKYKVNMAFPHIKVFMMDPKWRTFHFGSSATSYTKRKQNSWDAFQKMVGKEEAARCKQAFRIVGKPTKKSPKGVVKYAVDPVEALLYAIMIKDKYEEFDKKCNKPATYTKIKTTDTEPIISHSIYIKNTQIF